MVKLISLLVSVMTLLNAPFITPEEHEFIMEMAWAEADDDERKALPIEYQAHACGMSETEFTYIAKVVQAESNGTTDWSDYEDKVLIACVILNRVADSRFPNTIQGVLDQSGQFSTTSGGWCSTPYTDSSRWAIVEAQRRLAEGTVPSNLLYFNCVSYQYGTPYGCYGGNYFVTA